MRNVNLHKAEDISLIQIIHNLDNNNYIKIKIKNDITLNTHFNEWNIDKFLFEINMVGMVFSEIFIGKASKTPNSSLDNFMINTTILKKNITSLEEQIKQIEKYPFKKGHLISKEEFKNSFNLYFNEDFMEFYENKIEFDFSSYIEGYFYFNELSVVVMGCELKDEYWYFCWLPYI